MHSKFRIGLFLALLIIFSVVSLVQSQEDDAPTGTLVYINHNGDASRGALYQFSFDDETSVRLSPEDDTRSDFNPIFSPNGAWITFSNNNFLSFMRSDRTDIINTDIERALYVSWSWDSTQVAFLTPTREAYNIGIYSLETAELRIYESPIVIENFATPSWSHDNQSILFSAYEQSGMNNDIYSLSTDFETLTTITNSPALSEASPSVSPNGMFISYKVKISGSSAGDVWVMDSDGNNQRNLTNGDLVVGSLNTRHIWSPDSTRVVMEDAGQGIAIIDITTGAILSNEGEKPAWSPDGQWIAYMQFSRSSDGYGFSDIYIAPANNPTAGEVILEDVFSGLAWQPDPSLTFDSVTIPEATPDIAHPIIESVLVAGQMSAWYFDADADAPITIIVQSDVFDTIAQLYTLAGTLIAENDDFDGTNSQIDLTLPAEGVYQVVITSFYGDSSGAYNLTVIGADGDLREKAQGGRFIDTPTPTATVTATNTPTATFTPTVTPTATITPSPTFGFDRAQCPANLPPQLAIGGRGRVLPGGASTVYEQPLSNSAPLSEIPGGVSFTVLDGPVCTDGFIWWQVEYRQTIGWVIEAGSGVYFLEPLRR